jgi:hypothetical protein
LGSAFAPAPADLPDAGFACDLSPANQRMDGGSLFDVLLATDTTLLYASIMDWGPVVLQNLLLVLGLLLFERWHVKRNRVLFFFGALCFGLGLWDKALFFWNLGGMAVAFLIVGFPFIKRNFRWQLLVAGGLGFLLGLWPLIRYNIRHRGATLAENTDFVYDQIGHTLRYLQLAADDKASIAPFADYSAPPTSAPVAAPFGHSAIVLSKRIPAASAGPRFWLIVALLARASFSVLEFSGSGQSSSRPRPAWLGSSLLSRRIPAAHFIIRCCFGRSSILGPAWAPVQSQPGGSDSDH